MRPEITVITVCYNAIEAGRREMLLQCLDSVQQQVGVGLEHLVIDGASTDGTVALVQAYQATNHPLRLISEPDKGIYDAMNKGLREAQGDYVIYLNTDDYYHHPEGLKESLRVLQETGASFSFAPIYVLWEKKHKNPHVSPCPSLYRIFFHSVLSHQSLLVRRDVMLAMGGFDTRYRSAADYDLELRLILAGHKGCFVPLEFVTYRMIGLSSVNKEQSQRESADALRRNINDAFGCHMTEEEALYLHRKHRLPQAYKGLFKRFLAVTDTAFVGVRMTWTEAIRCRLRRLVEQIRYSV